MRVRTVEEIVVGNLLLGPSRGSTWGTRSGWLALPLLVRALLVGALLVGALSGSLCFIAVDKLVGTLAEATFVPVTTGIFVTHLPPVEGIAVALRRSLGLTLDLKGRPSCLSYRYCCLLLCCPKPKLPVYVIPCPPSRTSQ